jgi:hypothetical protein
VVFWPPTRLPCCFAVLGMDVFGTLASITVDRHADVFVFVVA